MQRPADSVVVQGTEPACDLELVEVLVLTGDVDGVAPRPPVALGPNGSYVTSTYSPGRLAVWSAKGDLERVIGYGPGEGPGEFSRASSLLVDADRNVVVSDGAARWISYTWDGEHVRTDVVPEASGTRLADITADSSLIGSGVRYPNTFVVRWGDSLEVAPTAASGLGFPWAAADPSNRVWVADQQNISILRLAEDLTTTTFRIRREVPFSEGPMGVTIVGLDVDDRGVLWYAIGGISDPTAPATPMPTDDIEAFRAVASDYLDGRIEGVLPDGTLVASLRLDNVFDLPLQMRNGLWTVWNESDILPSIRLVRPRLVTR